MYITWQLKGTSRVRQSNQGRSQKKNLIEAMSIFMTTEIQQNTMAGTSTLPVVNYGLAI